MIYELTLPLKKEELVRLKVGDEVLLSGEVYTARDAAHKRFSQLINDGKPLPIDIKDKFIYYAGPSPAPPGYVIGSAGPTTSGRMDSYAPTLYEMGLAGTIGKGSRSDAVVEAIVKRKGVYLAALGGAGALAAKCITACELVCYDDLGSEAVYKVTFDKFPTVVAVDSSGNDVYN